MLRQKKENCKKSFKNIHGYGLINCHKLNLKLFTDFSNVLQTNKNTNRTLAYEVCGCIQLTQSGLLANQCKTVYEKSGF